MMRRYVVWFAVAIAVVVMLAVAAGSAGMWRSLGASEITFAGWLAMVMGVLFSLALGIGLMALVFFSNRRGYDDQDRSGRE